MTRSTIMEIEVVLEFYTDWGKKKGDLSNLELGCFTPFCIDICWEGGIFTFHLALLGVHFGRSVKVVH